MAAVDFSMFFMRQAPIFDVASAVEVLGTRSYRRLPRCIEDLGTFDTDQAPALSKLDTFVRSKLLQVSLPKGMTINVFDGVASLRVDGEFKVLVTLGYRGDLSLWRILHLELLVREKSGPVKVDESRRHVLGDDLERRMAASQNPFVILYSILHELCVAIIMDTVVRQVQALLLGRWKDAIRFELISDRNVGQGGSSSSPHSQQDREVDSVRLQTPGVKVIYWLDPEKNYGAASDGRLCPYLRIEPGQDMQIKVFHSTFVIDPLTGKGTDFSLNKGCIDIETLLLKAIGSVRYTHLLEISKELENEGQINMTPGDVQLHFRWDKNETEYVKKSNMLDLLKHDGQEALHVRAYGSSFFTLGISTSVRNSGSTSIGSGRLFSVTIPVSSRVPSPRPERGSPTTRHKHINPSQSWHINPIPTFLNTESDKCK